MKANIKAGLPFPNVVLGFGVIWLTNRKTTNDTILTINRVIFAIFIEHDFFPVYPTLQN
ncbi:hypothetical protein [Sporosarcina sp. A2]|uniref:hypothetical protein n=1 Tax=Sporosarcina sp. A2 TaxID=3393449 RepID=UPI003D7A8DFB